MRRTPLGDGPRAQRRPWFPLAAFVLGFATSLLAALLLGVDLGNYEPVILAFVGGFVGVLARVLYDRKRARRLH